MNTRKAWLVYIVLRLLFFAVPFAVLYPLAMAWLGAVQYGQLYSALLAGVLATFIGASLSVIFLSKHREAASAGVHEWRNRERTPDDIVEDEAIEAVEAKLPPEPRDSGAVPEAESVANAEPIANSEPSESPSLEGESDTQQRPEG